MSIHQHATIEDTVYFWFGANDTSGSGADGATPVYNVRLAGGAADLAPVVSAAATLLTHGDFPPGCHEIAIVAGVGTGTGFAANATYAVFCTLLVDSQNPTGFVGSFTLGPIVANTIQISDDATVAANLKDILNGTGATLTLDKFKVNGSDAAGVVDINNTGGPGIKVNGTTYGMDVSATAGPGLNIDSSVTDAVVIGAGGSGDGVAISGRGTGAGLYIAGGGTGQGLLIADGLSIDTVEVTGTTTLTGAITMPAGLTADITGTVSGNATSGALATHDGKLDTLTTQVGTAGDGLTDLGSMSTAMKAEVLTQVNTALDTAISELVVAAPSITPSIRNGIMLMYMALRNQLKTQRFT